MYCQIGTLIYLQKGGLAKKCKICFKCEHFKFIFKKKVIYLFFTTSYFENKLLLNLFNMKRQTLFKQDFYFYIIIFYLQKYFYHNLFTVYSLFSFSSVLNFRFF